MPKTKQPCPDAVRLKSELKAELLKKSAETGIPKNRLINQAIAAYLKADQQEAA